jgi:hypothetical protein
MDTSERFEQLIAFVGAQLPKPVEEHQSDDGSFIFTGGEPAEVIVQITESTVLVAAFVPTPDGGRSPIEPQPVGELHWRRLPETAVMNALSALIKGSREVRLATYRVCLDCGETRAPEDMAAEDMCRECAEAPPRTVH